MLKFPLIISNNDITLVFIGVFQHKYMKEWNYERLSAFIIDALNVSFRNHVPIFVFHPFIPFIIHFPKLRIVFARKNTNRHTLRWCGMCLFAMHVALYQFSKIINLLFPA